MIAKNENREIIRELGLILQHFVHPFSHGHFFVKSFLFISNNLLNPKERIEIKNEKQL